MIKLVNIEKEFSNCRALCGINLLIPHNEFVAVTGESGSGKSTLLSIISGLDTPTSGTVYYDNIDINKLSEKRKADIRKKKIGFIFQNFFLVPEYTVFQNIEMPLLLSKGKHYKDRCYDIIEKVGLTNKAKVKASNLSGGEQQRCAIARALIADPEIIFADEPCGNLDTQNGQIIMGLLRQMKVDGKTIVLVTHNPQDAKQADRIITLKDGTLISDVENY